MYGIKINILRFHARVNSIYLLEDNYFLAINISKPTSVSMKMLFHSPNREFSVINSREPLKLSFVNWSSMTFTQFNVFDTTRHMNHLSLQFVPPPSPLSYRRHLWLRFIQKVKSLNFNLTWMNRRSVTIHHQYTKRWRNWTKCHQFLL